MVQWLRLCASTPGGVGSIPGPVAKISQAVQCAKKKKKRNQQIFNPVGFVLPFTESGHLDQTPCFIVEETEDKRGKAADPWPHSKVVTELESELGLRFLTHCDTAL